MHMEKKNRDTWVKIVHKFTKLWGVTIFKNWITILLLFWACIPHKSIFEMCLSPYLIINIYVHDPVANITIVTTHSVTEIWILRPRLIF
jgi:hypothetical protein